MLSKDFHASRRKLYADLLEDGSVGFVFCGKEKEDRGDLMHPFTPYANFYYLTGFTEPKAVLMVTKTSGNVREDLFIDHPESQEMARPLLYQRKRKRRNRHRECRIPGKIRRIHSFFQSSRPYPPCLHRYRELGRPLCQE